MLSVPFQVRAASASLHRISGTRPIAFLLVSGLSFPVGALGILFALLSRKGDKMDSQARLGCILSSIGLCLGIAIFIYAAVTVYQNFPEFIQQYQQLYEMYQGGM